MIRHIYITLCGLQRSDIQVLNRNIPPVIGSADINPEEMASTPPVPTPPVILEKTPDDEQDTPEDEDMATQHVVQEDTLDDDIDTPPVVKEKDTQDDEDTATTRLVVQEDTTPCDISGKRMRLADNLSEYFRPTSTKRARKAPVKYI